MQDILINEGEGKVDFFSFNIFLNIIFFLVFFSRLISSIVDNTCTNQNICWSPESVGDKKSYLYLYLQIQFQIFVLVFSRF